MSAPESNTQVESALMDALAQRRSAHPGSHPSLVDVHRRARRRSSRRAAVRAGAVVGAGAAVVAGGWAVAQRGPDGPATALPAGAPASAAPGPQTTTLSVTDLWSAVADRLGTTVDDLAALNPDVDFAAAPVPGTPLLVAGAPAPPPTATVVPPSTVVATVDVPPPTATVVPPSTVVATVDVPPPTATVVPPSTVVATVDVPGASSVPPPTTVVATSTAAAEGHVADCVLTDEQIESWAAYIRSIPARGETPTSVGLPDVPPQCLGLPPLPEGWTLYQIVPGDHLAGIAERHCTTAAVLAAGNEWADGVNVPLFPTDIIAVPAGSC